MTAQTWQTCDPQGRPIPNGGYLKHEVAFRGLLHSVAHVWLWRNRGGYAEVLVQKRAATKVNWPGLYDKSAGGHLAFGEEPLEAAVRRVHEELGIKLKPSQLQLAGVHRWFAELGNTDLIENELQWVYLAEVKNPQIILDQREVQMTYWKTVIELTAEACAGNELAQQYAPYGRPYYLMLQEAMDVVSARLKRYTAAM